MNAHDRQMCEACLREEYDSFRHDCVHESMAQNDAWSARYKINDWPRWDYSMEDATLTFSEDGEIKVVCKIQVVGSVKGSSWEWSWGNPHLPESCRHRLDDVYVFGQEKLWDRLTTLFLAGDEFVGWECASVASHLLGGIGVYRCPNRDGGENDAVYVVVLSAEFVQ